MAARLREVMLSSNEPVEGRGTELSMLTTAECVDEYGTARLIAEYNETGRV